MNWEIGSAVSLGRSGIEPGPLAWLILRLYGEKVNGDYRIARQAAIHRINFGCYPWSKNGDKNQSE